MKVPCNGIKYYANAKALQYEDDGRFATILSSFFHLNLVPRLIENNNSVETTENSLDTDIKPVIYKFSFLHLLYFIEVKNSFTEETFIQDTVYLRYFISGHRSYNNEHARLLLFVELVRQAHK